MPGFLLHVGTGAQCVHAGIAKPGGFNPRVTVSGKPIVTMANAYLVAGCTFPAMTLGAQPPCVTAKWATAAMRVTSLQQPVLLQDSQANCIPTGTPLLIMGAPTRVTAI